IGMAVADPDGRLQRVNDAFASLLGYLPAELAGRKWLDLTHPDDRQRNLALFDAVRSGESEAYEIEKRYLRKDGAAVWVLVRASAIRSVNGSLLHQIGQVVDISAQKRAAEALEELVRAKDQFVASVSHELRTPLTVVQGLAEELRATWRDFDPREVDELVALIAAQSGVLANLIEDLLVEARADIGKVTVVPERVEVLAQVQGALDGVAGAEGVELGAGGLVEAMADPVRLRQILRNLILNAIRYGGPNVRVIVRSRADGAVVEVVDDGPGIPADQWEAIFEPYHRAHNALGQPASVGLGLTVSRKLARLMGGDLAYRSEAQGSVFALTLPAPGHVPGPGYHLAGLGSG
ncbi:MAG: PAS domain S-box protein, partial [Acidimicrobiia bacterium]